MSGVHIYEALMDSESVEMSTEEPHGTLASRRRRWPWVIAAIIVLAFVGTGGAYAWLNGPNLIQQLSTRGTEPSGPDADDKAVLTDLMAAQQKTSEDLSAVDRRLAEQDQQLITIVDRLAELSSKLDALQSAAATSRPATLPTAAQPAPAQSPPSSTIARPTSVSAAATRPKKPARAIPPPNGPISLGGVPLAPKPTQETR